MRLHLLLIVFVLLTSNQLFAQPKGSIKGKVKDISTKEEIPFANVVVEGVGIGTSTDIEGNFILQNIPVGVYSISVTYISYKKKQIDSVSVQSNKVLLVEVGLEPDVETLGEVVVSEARETFSEIAVMSEIKLSKQVIVGISAEQISRSQDNTAAQAMSRIPGVTVTDGRFVMIRGVSQRYNAVQLNGANAPSTEIDSRAFSFDLIPTGLIDRMLINKSGSPEYPGDFAGGVIRIYTKNVPDENFTALNVGFGYRTGTTGQEGFRDASRSSTDWLGYDNGSRAIPAGMPDNVESLTSSAQRAEAGKLFNSNFLPKSFNISPDYKFGLTIGRANMFLGTVKFATISSLNYSASFQNINYDRARYQERSKNDLVTPLQYTYDDKLYGQDVRITAMSNWSIVINSKNRIEFRNSFNQLGESESVIRRGTEINQRPNDDDQNYAVRYLSRSIYSGQLNGNHKLSTKLTYDWVVGFTSISRNEPDFRRIRTFRAKSEAGTDKPFRIQYAPGTSLSESGRFYSNLTESNIFHGSNFEYKLKNTADEKTPVLRMGVNYERRSRDFRARYLNYNFKNSQADIDTQDSLRQLSPDIAFAPQNLSVNGWLLNEGTTAAEKYTATNTLIAAYLGTSVPLGKLDLSGGIRIESNNQELLSATRGGIPARGGQSIVSPLVFVNFTYDFTETLLGRLAYNRTINRPEFRELAPFSFYDFVLDANFLGNPDLKICNINNYDARLEWYPNVGEILSIGGFYKTFINPVEVYLGNAGGSPQFTYGNAKSAVAFGIEAELKKSLESLAPGSTFLKNLTFSANASLIRSQVKFDSIARAQDGTPAQDEVRPLQGQSPYVINTGLTYNNPENKTAFNLSYNIFGPRIFAVGGRAFPTVWELPRHSIDLSLTKNIAKNIELKFGIQDLLNYQYRFYQDTNLDGKVSESDKGDPIFTYRKGTAFSFGATIKF
jgi:TonB-dependent receptor